MLLMASTREQRKCLPYNSSSEKSGKDLHRFTKKTNYCNKKMFMSYMWNTIFDTLV